MAPSAHDDTSERHANGINGTTNGFVNSNPLADSSNDLFSHVTFTNPVNLPVPIAIVGMGMRLPGGCHDAEAFWDLLIHKKEGMIPVPSTRWDLDGFHDDSGRAGTVKAGEGNFLDIDLGAFDAGFFSMTPSAIEEADPQQRLFLETVYESLENAGEKKIRGRNIGVYVGLFAEDWIEMRSKDSEPLDIFGLTGRIDLMDSNLVSYELDWTGPSMTFKTGCSASMIALDTACKALARGDCESAVVGGTNLILSPGLSSVLSKFGVNSAEGRSRPFDANASGYGRAEAVSSLYIKRLNDAIHDGNPIRGVIRATLCNDDGKTPGITQPNMHAHESLIRRTYELAGLADRYHETGFFECHGTGTPVGDPIEVNAVARVFGSEGMIIGSVKSNVGHSEACSGNTSIIKSVLALEHQTIPPNVNFNTPNPRIPWQDAKLRVPTEPIPWPTERQERVSVNSFGIGGSNAHVILESARLHGIQESNVSASEHPRLNLLLFSAKSAQSLQNSIGKYSRYIEKYGEACLYDLAYTLANRRVHHEHRTFAIADGPEDLEVEPTAEISTEDKSVVFIFTGQGAQWAEMGKQLLDDFPSVRDNIMELDKILATCQVPPTWTIYEELGKPKRQSCISKAEFSQPLCTAIQIVLVDLLRCWGVTPAAVAGHSSGEIATAYATGSLSKREAILAAYFRGYVTREKSANGTMAAVGLGAARVRPYLAEGAVIGCENSPDSTAISGDTTAVETTIETLHREMPGVFVRTLQVDNAYHSHQMRAYGPAYEELIKYVTSEGTPTIPLFSSVTGKRYSSPGVFNASYWRRNLESPVLFHTAVRNLINADFRNLLLVEIGPHSALSGPIRQIFQAENKTYTYVHSLVRGRDDTQSIYDCIGTLWCNNVSVDFEAMMHPGKVLTDLPTYSWDHSRSYWKESRICREWRQRKFLPHETLGNRLPGTSQLEPTWRNMASLAKAPWIRDHVVGTDIVFPGAGYIAMAGEAIRQLTGRSDYSVRGLAIKTALIFTEKENDVVTTFKRAKVSSKEDSDWWEFRVTSFNGSTWNEHCSGQARAGPIYSKEQKPPEQPHYLRKVSSSRWYEAMQRIGFTYGPEFRGMKDITVDPISHETTGNIEMPAREATSPYELHPCEIDKILQLLAVTQHKGEPSLLKQLSMPTYFDEVYVAAGGASEIRATAFSKLDHVDTWTGSAFGTCQGKMVFELRNLSVSAMGASKDAEEKPQNAVELVWQPDVEFLDAKDVIRTRRDIREHVVELEKYFFFLALEALPSIVEMQRGEAHLVRFRDWLHRFVQRSSSGDNRLVPDGPGLAVLGAEERRTLVETMSTNLMASPVASAAAALRRVCENAKALYEGAVDTLSMLMDDEMLMQIYAIFDQNWDYSSLVSALGHKKPMCRVLEIGARTGDTTSKLLEGLTSEFGQQLYSTYSYTDTSPRFFDAAKKRFQEFNSIEFQVLDISHPDIPAKALQIYEQTLDRSKDAELDPDYEFAIENGVIYSPRYHWYSPAEELRKSAATTTDKVLMIGEKGMIDSLRWEENWRVKRPLREGEVLLKPHTVGINFKDILTAQGVVDGSDLGGECSGTILEVGPGVTSFAPGDRIFTIASYCFSNKLITSQHLLAKIPDGLSMEGAGTMGTVFTTAIYALCHLRRLEKGQTILIHSACGAVGIAAIQIAQMVGARILATVGNQEKIQYLMDTFNIPRHHIFDSHSNSFVRDVMAATAGQGVDIALNSLAGELLHSTWRCIAPFGAMIEIGKRDLYGHGKVDMHGCTENRSFFGLDARHMQIARPAVCGQMLRECAGYFEQGFVRPIPTFMNVPAENVADAFRHMQKGTHIGKFAVTMPTDLSHLPVSAGDPSLELRHDASYLLVGGLGGLGRSIASWFVSNGAKTLVFLSRSGRSEKHDDFCKELEVMGCRVQVLQGSVADPEDVKRAVAEACAPIRGVVQLSMVLQDRAIDSMGYEDWYTAVRPKVDGTWNLHNALGSDLEFFVLFGSVSGLVGQYGQANYAAANTFLDAFVQYRHGQGLPASVIDLGVMEDVGYVSQSSELLDYFRCLDADLLGEEAMREGVRLAISRSFPRPQEHATQKYSNPSQIALGVSSRLPISDPKNRSIWKRDRRFSIYHGISASAGPRFSTTDERLKSFLNQLASRGAGGLDDDKAEYLAKEIGKTLYGFMMKNPDKMDMDQPLSTLGLDSLVGIELRNWCRAQIGLEISILTIMKSTLRVIGKKALDFLAAKYT